MTTQLEMWRDAERHAARLNEAFLELVSNPTNPMTRDDLARLIARRPHTYGRFSGFLDKLPAATACPALQRPAPCLAFAHG